MITSAKLTVRTADVAMHPGDRHVARSLRKCLRSFHRCSAALVIAASLSLPSCSGRDYRLPDTSPSGTDTPIFDVNSRNPDTLLDGQTLHLAISQFPQTFNPLNSAVSVEYLDIAKALYPRSFVVGRDGSAALNTDFFSSVVLTSTDPQVVTYTINPKAVWTDGTPITWQDIASQIHALSGADPGFSVDVRGGFDSVASVTKGADDRQAIVTYKRPYSQWRGMFAGNNMLLPRTMTATPEAFNDAQRDQPGPSAGPFLVSQTDKDFGITLSRNPKWWGSRPRLDAIIYSVIYPDDQAQALKRHDIDAARVTSNYDLADILHAPEHFTIRRAAQLRVEVVIFNGAPGAILAIKELRLAICKGIDREALVNMTLRGLVDNPSPVNNHVFVPGQPGYTDNTAASTALVAYNPAKANQELDDLGWKMTGDVRIKDGKPLILRDVFPFNSYDWELARMLQTSLAQIGVRLIIDNSPKDNYIASGQFDLVHYEFISDAFPLSDMEDTYRSDGVSNYGKIGSQAIDAKIEQAMTEGDESNARDIANKVDQMIWDECHSVPLGESPGIIATRSDLANYGAFGQADTDYTAIGFTP